MHWFAHARGHTWGIARNMPRSAPQGITCPDSLDAPPMGRKAPEWVLNQSRMRLRQTFRPQWEMMGNEMSDLSAVAHKRARPSLGTQP